MGIAYLKDGTIMDYEEYIRSSPYWQKVKLARFRFDDKKCAICRKDLDGKSYDTHHLSYLHLGQEHMRDVVTLCKGCHSEFHRNWTRQKFWYGKEKDHWERFSIRHTAILCAESYKDDMYICNDYESPNLCNLDTCRGYVEDYLKTCSEQQPAIDPNDLSLFVRNKRYEKVFVAEEKGMTVEQFLDSEYGQKIRGKNPLRRDAGKKNGPFDHTLESFHRHYKENKNLNMLMEEVKAYEQTKQL